MDPDHHLYDPQASPNFNFNSINISNTYNTPGPTSTAAGQFPEKEPEPEPEDEPDELQPQFLQLAPYEPFIAVLSVHEDYTEVQIGLDLIARDPKPPRCDDCHSIRKDGGHPIIYECFECIPPKVRPLCKRCAEKELSDLSREEYFHKPDHERVRRWAPTWHYNLLQASKIPMLSSEMEEWAQENLADDIRSLTFSSQEFYEDRTIRFFMPAPQGLCRVSVQVQIEPITSKRREAHWKDEAKGWLESHIKGMNLLGMKETFGKIGVSAHAFDLSTAPISPRSHVAKDPPHEPRKDEKTTSTSISLRRGDDLNKTRTLEVYVQTGFQQGGIEVTLQDEYLESEEFHDSPFRWTIQSIKVVQLTQRVPSFASQAQTELYRRKMLKDKEEEHERRQKEWEERTQQWKEESEKRQEEYQRKLQEQQEKREQERRQIAVEQEEQRQALANEKEERQKQREQEEEERRKQRRQEDEDRRKQRRQAFDDEQEERRTERQRKDEEQRRRQRQEDEERRQQSDAERARQRQRREQYDRERADQQRDRYDHQQEQRGRDRERPTHLQQPGHDIRRNSMPAKQNNDKPAGLNIRYDTRGSHDADHSANTSHRHDRPSYSQSQSYQDIPTRTGRYASSRDRYPRNDRLSPSRIYDESSRYSSWDHNGRSISPNWRAGAAGGTPPLTRWTSISSAHSHGSGDSSPYRRSAASPPPRDAARLSVSSARRASSTYRPSSGSPSPTRRSSSAYRPVASTPDPARRTSTTYRPSRLSPSPGRRPGSSYRAR